MKLAQQPILLDRMFGSCFLFTCCIAKALTISDGEDLQDVVENVKIKITKYTLLFLGGYAEFLRILWTTFLRQKVATTSICIKTNRTGHKIVKEFNGILRQAVLRTTTAFDLQKGALVRFRKSMNQEAVEAPKFLG